MTGWRRSMTHLAVAGLVSSVLVSSMACARAERASTPSAGSNGNSDWSEFADGNRSRNTVDARAVPEAPIEITGAPYVKSVRLAWSDAERVPTYEESRQTLRIPSTARQAVLQIAISDLPPNADLRVDWYLGNELVFSDALAKAEDGNHYFALVMKEGTRLDPLPRGSYRAVVRDGTVEIKTVRFEVEA